MAREVGVGDDWPQETSHRVLMRREVGVIARGPQISDSIITNLGMRRMKAIKEIAYFLSEEWRSVGWCNSRMTEVISNFKWLWGCIGWTNRFTLQSSNGSSHFTHTEVLTHECVVNNILQGCNNYYPLSREMTTILITRGKLGFVLGTLKELIDQKYVEYEAWITYHGVIR